MTSAADCLFCGIVAGSIPATIVREDEATVAFLDIHPAAPIHILVIPREHAPNVAATLAESPETLLAVMAAATAVATEQGVAEGYRLVFNTGPRAGQTVFHTHAHVLGYPEGAE